MDVDGVVVASGAAPRDVGLVAGPSLRPSDISVSTLIYLATNEDGAGVEGKGGEGREGKKGRC